MTDHHSSRSEQLLTISQVGVKSLIQEPVKEAVREAIAEELDIDDEQRTQRSDTEDQTEKDTEDQAESGNRILRPGILLPILGLAVVGAIVRNRGTMKDLTGTLVPDESDGSAPPFDASQRGPADSDPTAGDESAGYEANDPDADSDELSTTE